MRISKLHLQNIGVFDDEKIEFKPAETQDQAEIHIFTGPNGCGKSTILMALAGACDTFHSNFPQQGRPGNFFYKRFRYLEQQNGVPQSNASIYFSDNTQDTIKWVPTHQALNSESSNVPLADYKQYALQPNLKPLTPLDFAVFAYSSYRVVQAADIDAIRELKWNPLYDALEFVKDTRFAHNRLSINQWIANSLSKEALEEKKNGKKAAKFAASLKALESAIASVTGWSVSFEMETDPFNLVVRTKDQELDFDVLPDGLRSLTSWMGDLLMRVDSLRWQDDLPAFEKNLILFLDEIEVHLHPAWQRKVLPVVQKLFKNSQIFLSTHSPFVVNSVDGAWVYELDFKETGSAFVREVKESKSSRSYETVLQEDFGIDELFGDATENQLDALRRQKEAILQGQTVDEAEFLNRARQLALQGADLQVIVQYDLRHLSRVTGKNYHL